MRLIIIGCEYTGKTTLARGIRQWINDAMGDETVGIHDDFLPEMTEGGPKRRTTKEDIEQFLRLTPTALEKYMRYMIHYHLGGGFYLDNDHLLVNWYYADAVYAPMYFDYGGPGEYADRRAMARSHDAEVMNIAPDTVLVHLTASVPVIRERMRAAPRPGSRVREEDIELICERFEEEFSRSLIRRRFTLDTSGISPEETMQAFLTQMETHWTQSDRLRILGHEVLQQGRDVAAGKEP